MHTHCSIAVALAGLLAAADPVVAEMPAPPQVGNRTLSTVSEGGGQVFRLDARDGDGVAWWPDVAFTTGTIDAVPTTTAAGANLSGTYVGQLMPEGEGDGAQRPGRILIVDRGETIDVTLGPGVEEMFPASRVSRAGNTLTIEADAPSDTPNHLRLEVTIAGDALTGRLVQTRDGRTRRARVVFTRQ
jgi:hypothetical protein